MRSGGLLVSSRGGLNPTVRVLPRQPCSALRFGHGFPGTYPDLGVTMSENEKIEENYDERRVHLARRPHDVSSAWILAAVLGVAIVLAFGSGALSVGKTAQKTEAASGSNDSVPLAELIGMSLKRAR